MLTRSFFYFLVLILILSSCKSEKDIQEQTNIAHRPGFVRYWDEDAKAPYLWNEQKKQLVVYDDEESVRVKCEYVKENNLGGAMFW